MRYEKGHSVGIALRLAYGSLFTVASLWLNAAVQAQVVGGVGPTGAGVGPIGGPPGFPIGGVFAQPSPSPSPSPSPADVVIKDTLTNNAWYGISGGFFYEQHDIGETGENQQVLASKFRGNGMKLATVDGIFLKDGGLLAKNGGSWSDWGFRVVFYENDAAFAANSAQGSVSLNFEAPLNVGWDQPIASWKGWNLHRFSFDVSELNILTVVGQEHLVAVLPFKHVASPGKCYMMFALGGIAPGGLLTDWYEGKPSIAAQPVTQLNLPPPYQWWGTYRIVLTTP